MQYLYPILFIFISLFTGCSDGNRATLEQANAIMEEDHDSALQILNTINREELNKRDVPYYSLLMTQALIKNFVPVSSDSLISIAYRKYNNDLHGDRGIRSQFYMGEILYNQKNHHKAIKYYLSAYEEAKRLKNDYWRAKAAEMIADSFCEVYNYEGSIKYRKEAILYYGKAGRIANQRYACADLSGDYIDDSKEKEALSIIDSVFFKTMEDMPEDTFLLDYIRRYRIDALIDCDRVDDLDTVDYNMLRSYFNNPPGIAALKTLCKIGKNGDSDIAERKLDSIFKITGSYEAKGHILYAKYLKAKREGRVASSLEYLDSILYYQNDICKFIIEESIRGAEGDFYTDLSVKNKRKSELYFFLLIFTCSLTFAIWRIYRLKNIACRKKIEASVEDIVTLRANSDKLDMERSILRDEINEKSNSIAKLRESINEKTRTISFLENKVMEEKNSNALLEDCIENKINVMHLLNLSLDDKGKLIERLKNEISRLEEEIKEHSCNIEILKKNLDAKSSDIMSKNVVMENLFRERWTTLNMLCNEYYEKGDSPVLREKIIGSIEKELKKIGSKKSIEQIEEAVNKYCDGILDDLKRECPNLTERDVTLATLIMAGFSVKAISYLLGIKTGNLYMIRRRLIERISNSNAPDKERFIERFH